MMNTFKPIKKRLGDMLVDTGIITSSQLTDALELKRKRGIKIGHALLELKYVSKDVLLAFLGRQCGISYVSLKEFGEVSDEAVRAVPEYLAREWEVFPLSVSSDGIITVAVSDPFNLSAIDDLRLISGYDVKTVIAPIEEIKEYINKYYVQKGISDGSGDKTNRDYVIKSIFKKAFSLNATDIYLGCNFRRASYFLCRRHLKTVEFTLEETDVIENFFKKLKNNFVILKESSHNISLYYSASDFRNEIIKNDERVFVAESLRLDNSEYGDNSVRIKIRNLPLVTRKNLNELMVAPEDVMIIDKHLSSSRGIIFISSEPSGGKTYFLEMLISKFIVPHKQVYYFRDENYSNIREQKRYDITDLLHRRDNSFNIISTNQLKQILPAPADVIFCDTTSREVLSEICNHSENSLVVVTSYEEKIPDVVKKISIPHLYIRLKTVRRLCPECRVRYAVSPDYLINSGIPSQEEKEEKNEFIVPGGEDIILTKPAGCEHCEHTGYKGLVPAYYMAELPLENPVLADGLPTSAEIRRGIYKSLWDLALKGEISIEEVVRYPVAS